MRKLALPLLVLYATLLGTLPSFGDEPKPAAAETEKPKVKVTISKEITRVTEPLNEAGYPDYVAALNNLNSEGVTPPTNASVLFWKATGPAELDAQIADKFWRLLGIEALPAKGDYFISIEKFAETHPDLIEVDKKLSEQEQLEFRQKALDEQEERATKRLWKEDECPLVAAWLKANEIPIRLVVEGSKRPHRFDSYVGDMVITILLPGAQASRNLNRLFITRAMLHAGHDHMHDAWQDLLTSHRIASLIGRSQFLVEGLVSIAIHETAFVAERTILQTEKLTASELIKMRKELAATVRIPEAVHAIDVPERWAYCDAVCLAARTNRPLVNEVFEVVDQKNPLIEAFKTAVVPRLNYDLVLAVGNAWYDRLVTCMRETDRAKRKQQFASYNEDLKKISSDLKRSVLTTVFFGSEKTASEFIGGLYVTLLLPALEAAAKAEDRAHMRLETVDLGFALALYKHEHQRFPERLEQLVPKYRDAIPIDLLGNAPLHYSSDGKGCLLYSVGHNGVDDAGRTWEDAEKVAAEDDTTTDWDDLSLHVPADWQKP